MTDDDSRIAAWLDGSLSEDDQFALNDWLRSDDDNMRCFADAVMFEQQIQSAVIGTNEQSAAASFHSSVELAASNRFAGRAVAVVLATMATVIAFILWPQTPIDPSFAILVQTRAALWESGELPTADGSRQSRGTLRLAEGLDQLVDQDAVVDARLVAAHQGGLHRRRRDLVGLDAEPLQQHGGEDRDAERLQVVADRSDQDRLLGLLVFAHGGVGRRARPGANGRGALLRRKAGSGLGRGSSVD